MTSAVATVKSLEFSRILEERTESVCEFQDEDVDDLGMSQTAPMLKTGKNGEPLWRPIKIHVDTDNIKHLSQEYQSYLTDVVIAQAHKILGGIVQVQSEGWIDQNQEIINKCNHRDLVKVSDRYKTEPVRADFIVFISVTPGNKKLNSIGKANPCYLEKSTNRPLAGFVILDYHNFQPNRESRETSRDKSGNFNAEEPSLAANQIKQDVYNYLHELLHTLIFSTMLFEQFPDVEGQPQMGECTREHSNTFLFFMFHVSYFICVNTRNYSIVADKKILENYIWEF